MLNHPLLLAFANPLSHYGIAVDYQGLGARSFASLAGGLPLRIMPLGASITWGYRSTDGNGYREALRHQLGSGGNPVNMVGAQRHGRMHDNDVEGYPGFRIDQVHRKAIKSVPEWLPNVVLVNVGTNDVGQRYNLTSVGERMERMLEDIFAMSPRTTVVLSSLVTNRKRKVDEGIQVVNQMFATIADKMREEGRALVYVDMYQKLGPSVHTMADNTHPNDIGYRRMANLWYQALVQASNEGLLQRAEHLQGVLDDGNKGRK